MHSLSSANSLRPRITESFSGQTDCETPANQGWSCGSVSEIKLQRLAQLNAEIDLIFELSNSATEFELEFVLGGSILTGTLEPGAHALTLRFANASPADVLTIRSTNGQSNLTVNEIKFVRTLSVIENR
jgi:hypothetical protein